MKIRNFIISLAAVVIQSENAFSEAVGYMWYVTVPYEVSEGKSSQIQVDDNREHDITIKGVTLTGQRWTIHQAVAKYHDAYEAVSKALDGNSSINKAVRASSLATWAQGVQLIINDGLANQETLNNEYAETLSGTVNENNIAVNAKQAELSQSVTTMAANSAATAADLTAKVAEVNSATIASQAQLKSVTEQLAALAAKTSLTPQEESLRLQLNNQQVTLANNIKVANNAMTKVQAQDKVIASMQAQMSGFESLESATNAWLRISKWLGFEDGQDAGWKNSGVFIEPRKFMSKLNEGTPEIYDVGLHGEKNDNTIYTQLRDAGYVGAYDDYMKERWDERGGVPKWHFELKQETVGGLTRTNCYTDAHGSDGKPTKDASGAYNNLFPPPRNWVDGTSIVCTDGVYRATSYTNAENGVEAERKRRGGGGGRGIFGRPDQDVNLNDPNDPLNPNSSLYPLNPSYDPNDVDNPWYHVFPHTDSEVTEQYWNTDFGTFKSIADLGKFSDVSTHNLTNVLGLQNFVYAFPFMIPWTFGIHDTGPGGYNASELMWAQTTNCFETVSDASASKHSKSAYSFNLKGFAAASEGQVPCKRKNGKKPDGTDYYDIGWTNAIETTVMTEHNGATAAAKPGETEVPVNTSVGGHRLIFRTADDSDVRINISTNLVGDTILTFGIYWK